MRRKRNTQMGSVNHPKLYDPATIATLKAAFHGHCQTNLSGPAKGAGLRRSGRQLTPLGQGGRTVLFEDVAAVEVTVVVEVVVD